MGNYTEEEYNKEIESIHFKLFIRLIALIVLILVSVQVIPAIIYDFFRSITYKNGNKFKKFCSYLKAGALSYLDILTVIIFGYKASKRVNEYININMRAALVKNDQTYY